MLNLYNSLQLNNSKVKLHKVELVGELAPNDYFERGVSLSPTVEEKMNQYQAKWTNNLSITEECYITKENLLRISEKRKS